MVYGWFINSKCRLSVLYINKAVAETLKNEDSYIFLYNKFTFHNQLKSLFLKSLSLDYGNQTRDPSYITHALLHLFAEQNGSDKRPSALSYSPKPETMQHFTEHSAPTTHYAWMVSRTTATAQLCLNHRPNCTTAKRPLLPLPYVKIQRTATIMPVPRLPARDRRSICH